MRFVVLILFIGSLALSLDSCKKGGPCVLQSFTDTSINTTSTNTFTYTKGKVTREDELNNSYTTYHYNDAGVIDTVSNYDQTGLLLSYDIYAYTGKNFSSKMTYSNTNGSGVLTLLLQRQYIYSGDSITRLNETLYSGGTTSATYTLFTYDGKGNIANARKYNTASSTLVYNRTYTYDTYSNPWGSLALYIDYFSLNNTLSQTDSQNPTSDITYTYQYNGAGFPISMTESYASNSKTETYNYNCP